VTIRRKKLQDFMNKKTWALVLALVFVSGAALGAVFHHVGLGVAFGIIIGAALGAARKRRKDKEATGA
jgi:F0F1-type ATP synthase membrane subunit c/vacuolar-type H+-ATPase subunit K